MMDWLSIGALILSLLAICISLVQNRFENHSKRKEFVGQLLNLFISDEKILKTFSMVDYNREWYTRAFHLENNKVQSEIDQLLLLFNIIVKLKQDRQITQKDFKLFDYQLNRILRDEQVQHYLWNLYHFSRKSKSLSPYEDLIDYMRKEKMIDAAFNSAESKEKYLNF
ncbi:MAG: hypothetical protein LBS41_03500 [Streptococcaceae bacterium]|jgi:hypothetical protein|nr:hypothetical protein [Streptococcaceae bacterium]